MDSLINQSIPLKLTSGKMSQTILQYSRVASTTQVQTDLETGANGIYPGPTRVLNH